MRIGNTQQKNSLPNINIKSKSYPVSYALQGQGTTGLFTSTNFIQEGYLKNTNAYSIIQLIAQQFAKSIFVIHNKKKEKEIKDHPLLDLINRPNQFQGKAEFLESVCGCYDLTGEAFIYSPTIPLGKNKGKPLSFQVLPPMYMNVMVTKDTIVPLPKSYTYKNGAIRHDISEEDMIYMRRWNPTGGVRGISPLASAVRTLVHDNDAVEANLRIIRNGGAKGILSFKAGADYDSTEIEKAQRRYEEKYGGAENYGKPMFLGEDVTWIEMGAKAEDLGIYQGRVMSMRDMCNAFNICSQLLNDPENKTYANMNEARKALITQVVLPRLVNFCDIINREILPAYDPTGYECLQIDKSVFEELAEDQETLATSLSTAWWMTANEKRKKMNLPEGTSDDWGAAYIPAGLLPLHLNGNDTVSLTATHAGEEEEPKEPIDE